MVLDEQAVLNKPAHDTGDDAVQKFVQILSVRRIDSMKTRLVVLHCVHPVRDDHVEVDVKVQRTAKALNEGHHAGSGSGSTGQPRGALCLRFKLKRIQTNISQSVSFWLRLQALLPLRQIRIFVRFYCLTMIMRLTTACSPDSKAMTSTILVFVSRARWTGAGSWV